MAALYTISCETTAPSGEIAHLDAMIFAALILLQSFFQFTRWRENNLIKYSDKEEKPTGFKDSSKVEGNLRVVWQKCGGDAK
jgi:hypothetical protein